MPQFIADFDFQSWLLGNILWVLFWSVLIVGLFKAAVSVVKALFVAKKLLKENRNTRGHAWGKYYADRFILIWYRGRKGKIPLRFAQASEVLGFHGNIRHTVEAIDRELSHLELIEIYTDHLKKYEAVRPIINFRNKCIVWLVEFWLVYAIGDAKKYYQQLKKDN